LDNFVSIRLTVAEKMNSKNADTCIRTYTTDRFTNLFTLRAQVSNGVTFFATLQSSGTCADSSASY